VLWLAALLAIPGPPPDRVALLVYPATADERVDAQAIHAVLDQILEHRLGLASIGPSDSVRTAALLQARACGSDRDCISARVREQGIRYALLVALRTRETPGLVSLTLLDTAGRGELLDQRLVEVATDPHQIMDALRIGIGGVLERTRAKSLGLLWIDRSPPAAEVLIEGPGAWRELSDVFRLVPGEHRIRVRAEGYVEEVRTVVIEADRDRREQVVLEEERSLFSSPWFWTVVGVAVAGSALAVWQLDPKNDRLCVRGPGGACP
jgi:hypothetical protein